jgi:hypothetical protein
MSDTPETDAFMTRIRGIDGDKHWVPADTAKRLERERASAIKKIQRQAERIRQLEGATNHAEGTPLSIALRERDEWAAMCGIYKQERDEAIEKYDNLATEHMLVVNKICEERDEAREEHRKLKIILDLIKKETL